MIADETYPQIPRERDQWVLTHRPVRNSVSPRRPHAFLVEREPNKEGQLRQVVTILLTNRECPWRCLMCDLWKNTLSKTLPIGAIPEQIAYALSKLDEARPGDGPGTVSSVKLYNSGSFFDSRAIPAEDHAAIAEKIRPFGRVIVECHPALINESVLRFRDLIHGKLEVAMGLETAHPHVLERLNKRMTLDQFARAAAFLCRHEIALRSFVLVKPPFLNEGQAVEWTQRSIDFAFACGSDVVSLIPVRLGNGALDTLAKRGLFSPPKMGTIERTGAYGVTLGRGRVFVDLWDLSQFSECKSCFQYRLDRLERMNELQLVPPEIQCQRCGGTLQ